MSDPVVVHLTPALFGEDGVFGGAERYTLELARAMARRTSTTLVCFGPEAKSFVTAEGLRVNILGPAWKVRKQEFNRLHAGLFRAISHADVVHCHQPRMLASEIAALYARTRGKMVVASDLGAGGWGFSSYVKTDKWFHSHLHISEYSRSLAPPECQRRSGVVWGGVDQERFSPDDAVPKEPLVVFVGRLMSHKGVENLIDALPEGLDLELIGRPYDERYFEELKRRSAGRRVIFRCDCDDDAIIHAFRRALVAVLPSVYRDCYGQHTRIPELLGQTPLEAMACGTPAVVTDVASLPEVVSDGVTGFVVSPNEPKMLRERLEWLRDHPEDAAMMGSAGRRRVAERFTWSSVVDRCLDHYCSAPAIRRIA